MNITLTNRRKWLLGAGAALLLTATPSYALFGIGDIVFDPTSYASLVSQLTTLETQHIEHGLEDGDAADERQHYFLPARSDPRRLPDLATRDD
jgi:hypothetical protein